MSRILNIHRGDAEARRFDEISDAVIGACIEIHQCLGPGLLESAYEECLNDRNPRLRVSAVQ